MDFKIKSYGHFRFVHKALSGFLLPGCFCLLLLILSSGHAVAQSLEKTEVMLNVNKASLHEVLKEIEKQTSFHFSYKTEDIKAIAPVSFFGKKESVSIVLRKILKGSSLSYEQVGWNIILLRKSSHITSQPGGKGALSLRGRVVDSLGSPLWGAIITVRGTSMKKITDQNGYFVFDRNIPDNAVLDISYIGFRSQEITLDGKLYLIVKMNPYIQVLNEVLSVSNGYQELPKERATGSFATLSGKELEKTPSTNIYDKLLGRIAGVYVNNRRSASSNMTSTSPILIRGKSSYSSLIDPGPLVVIDGLPYYQYNSEDVLSSVNPDDIESITVLKDAAASSIWGMQATNGVLVISTKKSRHNSDININFSSTLSITGKARLNTMHQMSSADYVNLEEEMVNKGFISDPYSYTYNSNGSQVVDLLYQYKRGLISQDQKDAQLSKLASTDNSGQIQKYLLQRPMTQQYNLSISGGSEKNTYILSGYFYIDRPQYKSNINRGWSLRSKNVYTLIKDKLLLTADLSYNGNKNKFNTASVNALGNGTYGFRRYDNLVDSSGTPQEYAIKYVPSVLNSLQNKGYKNWYYSPIDALNYGNSNYELNNLRGSLSLNGKITRDLSIELLGNIEKHFETNETYYEPESYYARDIVNYGTTISATTGLPVYGVPDGGILLTTKTTGNTYNLRAQVGYNKIWNQIHSLNIIAGSEIRQISSKINYNTLYGYNASFNSSSSYNELTYYNTVNGSTAQIGNSNTISSSETRWLSYYANAGYSLMGKYSFTSSIRFDDVSMIGVDKRKRARPFWSIGAKWDLYKENFLRNVSWIDEFSLRSTYGMNGVAPRNATTTAMLTVSSSADNTTNQYYGYIYTPANSNLGWETTHILNLGTDFAFFKRRIFGSIEFYFKRTKDIIYAMPINATYGYSTLISNTGSMKGHGTDVSLTVIPIQNKDFSWASNITFSYNTNKVTDSRLAVTLASTALSGTPIAGYPTDYLFVYRWAGLDSTGQSQVYLADGSKANKNTYITDFKNLKYAGRTTAPYFGGFSNTFTYKNFQIGVMMNYKFGNVFLKPSLDNYPTSSYFSGMVGKQEDLAKRWEKSGDEKITNVPGLTGMTNYSNMYYKYSSLLVRNGGYIRLQQISFGYNLSGNAFRHVPIKNMNISASINNLGLLWRANKDGLDPEYQRSSTSVNDNILPSITYALRISANF